jgi:hypothetical protein
MRSIIYILILISCAARGQDWDFVNYQNFPRMHQVMDDFGNQYIIVYSDNGNWAEPDSILRHSGCCNDTLRATNRERNKHFID